MELGKDYKMVEINANLIETLIKENLQDDNLPFDCEFGFQLSLAMKLKQDYPDIKIKFEKNIYDNSKARCDIIIEDNNEKILLELKYKCRSDQDKSSCGSRKSFIEDMKRLYYDCGNDYENAKKYCIFITNKPSMYNNHKMASGEVGLFNSTFGQECKWNISKQNNEIHFLIVEVLKKDAKDTEELRKEKIKLDASIFQDYKDLKFKTITGKQNNE